MYRKLRLLDHIIVRINGEVVGGTQVGAFEYGTTKKGPVKVTVNKSGFGKVGFGKVGFHHAAIGKGGFPHLLFVEDSVIQYTTVKINLEQKITAFTKVNSAKLAMLKADVLQAGIAYGS